MSVAHRPDRVARARDGIIGGVCAGLAKYFDAPAWLLRLIWIVAVLCYGTGILLYLVVWWLLPREDRLPFEPVTWEKGNDGVHRPPFQRTVVDRKVAGVCGGLGRRWDIDPFWVRLAFVGIVPFSLGLALIAYLVLAIVIPPSGPSRNATPTRV